MKVTVLLLFLICAVQLEESQTSLVRPHQRRDHEEIHRAHFTAPCRTHAGSSAPTAHQNTGYR